MKAFIFLLIVIALLIFIYKSFDKIPELQQFFSHLIKLLPSFDDENSDVKKFAFCLAVMIFLVGLAKVIFR